MATDTTTDGLREGPADGDPPGQWFQVDYSVCTHDGRRLRTLTERSLAVKADSEDQAKALALQWVEDNDPYYDDRVDPVASIDSVDELDDPDPDWPGPVVKLDGDD